MLAMPTRREFGKTALSGLALAALPDDAPAAARIDSTVRGVKLGITTASLNPLPEVPGKDRLDIVIEQCRSLDIGNVELSGGFFGPPVVGGAVGGQTPAQITPEYQK